MKRLSLLSAALCIAALTLASPRPGHAEPPVVTDHDEPPAVPAHNSLSLDAPPLVPAEGSATERAALLVEAIRTNDPTVALTFFFDRDAFGEVKAIKDPDKYFQRLLKVYNDDLLAMRAGLSDPDHVEFVKFELGRQRRWVERGKEANDLPYYAVYKSRITVRDAGREKILNVRVMITWDDQWFVTHLTHK